jgi:hypothetical protein
MALGLVSLGAPLMIGWTASVLHDVATELAEKFYGAMTTGQADRSPLAVRERCDQRDDPCWLPPVLYAGSRQARLFDPNPSRREAGLRPSLNPRPVPEVVDIETGARCWGIGTFELPRRYGAKTPADGLGGQTAPP